MSKSRKVRPPAELRAMEQALASLAERCVHAEARAKVAEAECVTLSEITTALKQTVADHEDRINRWWRDFWLTRGVDPKVLVQARVTGWHETVDVAKRLVYAATPGKAFYSHPDPTQLALQFEQPMEPL